MFVVVAEFGSVAVVSPFVVAPTLGEIVTEVADGKFTYNPLDPATREDDVENSAPVPVNIINIVNDDDPVINELLGRVRTPGE